MYINFELFHIMSMTTEFITAINQIAAERGIEKEEIFQALEEAILVAFKKEKFGLDAPEEENQPNWSVELNRETGEFKLIATKEVVKKVKDVRLILSKSNDILDNSTQKLYRTIMNSFVFFLIMYLCLSPLIFTWNENYYVIMFFVYVVTISRLKSKLGLKL